ncbi:MAG: multidrug effflux MFS transporter [Anaerolineae bacterium]
MLNASKSPNREPPLLILLLLVSFGSISAVLFTPALPEIMNYFHVTSSDAQSTMTLFLVGYAFGQLPYGPFANRYGRKPALFIGILLAIASSLLCILAAFLNVFWILSTARLLMALGASAGLKITFTIIGDVYEQAKATKIISKLILSFAIAPGVGIAIGGFLTEKFHWQSCFYFLTAYGILLLLLSMRLPETSKQLDPHALHASQILKNYLAKLKNSKLIVSSMIIGCGTSVIYIFASVAPFLSIELIKMQPSQYGLLNLIPPCGMILGSAMATKLTNRVPAIKSIGFGLIIMLVGALAMLIAFASSWINVLSLFLPISIIYVGDSLMYANTTSLAMSHAKNKSNASAVMNFINLGITVFAVFITGIASPSKAYVIPLVFVIAVLVMSGFHRKLSKLLARPTS